ncbi:hypothetical protein DICPUDRAFT_32417 [Dictyostelium purpureum]|uniref:glucose-6-phosphate 1-epimerase n=1 Tax=Dictyostelium purpureum TaxID=5786 RepID=F0ZJ06_DICPU|nr:uncharacterized protein DICPUDRAFT_32417 [Dictyostelium purpureum]EGC36075.1 hypothetical protein DICPUDRAFT_32417 [Dictyostelium purpureum]|eukprot:XP_003287393.1 hypothetical protein DICPUDRAFT_32417 [Dictyostelium purpureum]
MATASSLSIEQLQKLWNTKYLSVVAGVNNLPKFVLKTSTSSCEIYLHGAHVTSFKINSNENLFMSEKSAFQENKAIRGGIPLIWPQFGPGKIQTHGFARNLDWDVNKALVDEKAQSVQIEFFLKSSEATDKILGVSSEFIVFYRVTLHPDFLDLEYEVKNTSQQNTMEFQLAFHTYYSISDIKNVHVLGLKGREYIDKMKNMEKKKENRKEVTIDQEVDSVYLNVIPTQGGSSYQPLQLVDTQKKTSVTLTYDYQSIPDVVVWNPWIEKSKKMEDFGDEEYHKMICIEIGVINNPVKLSPNQTFQTKHSILPTNSSSSSL